MPNLTIYPELHALVGKIYDEHRRKFPAVKLEEQRAKLHGELEELQEAKLRCYTIGNPSREMLAHWMEELADVLICCVRLIGDWQDPEAIALFEKYFNFITASVMAEKWEVVKARTYIGNQHVETPED